jgi:ubiquinone/menaquinone biosynthesis C-methylase UbiE
MEKLEKIKDFYSPEWFQKRALSSLKQIDDTIWDYSDSLLIYTPGGDEGYEKVQDTENPYHTLVTLPEHEYLRTIAGKVVEELPTNFQFIDLGPGTEHKEQYVFDAIENQGKEIEYIPVDISSKFLALAEKYAKEQGIKTKGVRASFEELPEKLKNQGTRFVSLGLTYSNYGPSEILPVLREIAGSGGYFFINAQLRERVPLEKIKAIYSDNIYPILVEKMKLLGIVDEDIEKKETDNDLKIWFTLKKVPETLALRGVKSGDRMLVMQSLRPTKKQLLSDLSAFGEAFVLFEEESSFLGVLVRVK